MPSILVAGSIALDTIKTPKSSAAKLLGGSASYASLAASYLCNDVRLSGIIGRDFPPAHLEMLAKHGVRLDAVERSEGESFSWSGEYLANMNERVTHAVAVNVLETWQPKLPEVVRDASHIVLANMSPDNQLQVLDQCESASFVVADTMDLWISIARPRLLEVLGRIDLLVINESEAREFTGRDNLISAGAALLETGPAWVVIKLGEHGAFLFGRGKHDFFSCAAFPLIEVNDPTGAGDSFLGGLAGHLAGPAKGKNPDLETLKQAIVAGTIMASFTCEAFSTRRLEDLTAADIQSRLDLFRSYTTF